MTPDVPAAAPPEDLRETKSQRLIRFLQEVGKLRAPRIPTLNRWDVLWLHQIPYDGPEAKSQIHDPTGEFGEEVWLEIQKTSAPECPPVPDQLGPWLGDQRLDDVEHRPELLDSITEFVEREVPDPEAEPEGPATKVESVPVDRHLHEEPEIQDAWARYLEEHWEPWAERWRRWNTLDQAYMALDAMRRRLEEAGDRHEFLLGIGLLQWQVPSQAEIRRHVLTAQGEIRFDAARGRMTIGPAADVDGFRVELDMLDAENRPAGLVTTLADRLGDLDLGLTERDVLGQVLSEIANRIEGSGFAYPEDLVPAGSPPDSLEVRFAPALILRPRRPTAYQEVIDRVLERMKGSEAQDPFHAGSHPWQLLLGEGTVDPVVESGADEGDGGARRADERIYFPLPTNAEQKRIIEKHRSASGVLVQGPPGTGKSHTIANLISHLLACGERVLVTAHTPRALDVLRRKLPGDLADLCVCQLGSSQAERAELEARIRKILFRKTNWLGTEADEHRLCELEQEQLVIEEGLERTERQLREIRESETHSHVLPGGYRGTAAQIARRLAENEETHGWLGNRVPSRAECPVDPERAEWLARRLPALTTAELDELGLWPGPDDLPSADTFEAWVSREGRVATRLDEYGQEADPDLVERIRGLEGSGLHSRLDLLAELDDTHHLSRELLGHADGDRLMREGLGGRSELWESLCSATREELEAIDGLRGQAGEGRISLPEGVDRERLEGDCRRRLAYMRGGRWRGVLFVKPRTMRETEYLRECLVGGESCRTEAHLERLIAFLEACRREEDLWTRWAGHIEPDPREPRLRLAAIRRTLDAIERALKTCEGAGRAWMEPSIAGRKEVEDLATEERRADWRKAIETVLAEIELQEAREGLDTLEKDLEAPEGERPHDSVEALLRAVQTRDVAAYRAALTRHASLLERRRDRADVESTLAEIRAIAPKAEELLRDWFGDESKVDRVRDLPRAWAWSSAMTWIEEVLSEQRYEDLVQSAHRLRERLEEVTAQIASVRAWGYFLQRLDPQARQDLTAWVGAIERLGRGTGARAAYFRRSARKYLKSCLQAVPAWVMPLYKVWESVDPAPELFDTIIVDEASQCGIESLLLLYLAKRIIVVGDKKQVSPMAVGVKENEIQALAREHLGGFRYKEFYRLDCSLYDHAERAFGDVVVLREHFRCVPEIIRFSNDLCYREAPLIPLRQYPADRLEPLRPIRVDGKREGKGQQVINRIEAERLVETLEQCIQDERYEDCSFGVIALQGHAQAELIERMLVERIPAKVLEERRVLCGDPATFQGDERDVIFLSMVAAPNERNATLTSEMYVQRYNVAMSRARDQVWLFHSVGPEDLGTECLRRRLIDFFSDRSNADHGTLGVNPEDLERAARTGSRSAVPPPERFDSWFEVDVALELLRRGYRVVPQFEVSGYRIDLVVQGNGPQLAVECDGDHWHGAEQYEDDMARQRQLERAGWRFVRIRESEFYANRAKAIESVVDVCEELSIHPLLPGTRPRAAEGDAPNGTLVADDRASSSRESTADDFDSAENPPAETPGGQHLGAEAQGSRPPDPGEEPRTSVEGAVAGDTDAEGTCLDGTNDEDHPRSSAGGPFSGYGPECRFPDPRQASGADVRKAVYSIVERDGPLSRSALYSLYGKGCPEVNRVGRIVRTALDAAIAALLRSGKIEQTDELGDGSAEGMILRLPDQRPSIRPAGARQLQEIPLSEIGLVLEQLHPSPAGWSRRSNEGLMREILAHYGMQNLTRPRREYLTKVLRRLRSDRA